MSVTTANRSIGALLPVAQRACRLFLEECKKEGVDIFITETHRSQARQNWLYAQGRTRFPGPVVTWTLNSNHTTGLAWDVAVSPPKSLYDVATLNKAGAIARKLNIKWGGDWVGTIDRPHFQVTTNWSAPVQIASQSPDEIKQLQGMLNQVGFSLGVDGIIGKSTLNAIQMFQRRTGLDVDGSAGPLTKAKLKEVIAKNIQEPKKEDTILKLPKWQQDEMALVYKHARDKGVFSSAEHEQAIKDGTMTTHQAIFLMTVISGAALNEGKRIG